MRNGGVSLAAWIAFVAGCSASVASNEAPVGATASALGGDGAELRTCGRWLVDGGGRRVKLAGVNWYGGSDQKFVPGGLDKQHRSSIAHTIRALGFNSVRLPFSNEMLRQTQTDAAMLSANPDLVGKAPIEVYDAVVEALTNEGLYVVLNNHTTYAKWCCGFDADGLWYTADYPEETFIQDWERLAARYAGNPRVVGADLRNEIRIARSSADSILPVFPAWGGGGKADWRAAAERTGNRILQKNPRLLILVEGINAADDLRGAGDQPVMLGAPGKLVYSSHNYSFFRPNLPTLPGVTLGQYDQMSAADFNAAVTKQWGYLQEGTSWSTAPVWVGEFGVGPGENTWFRNLVEYLRQTDSDWAYWSLNGSPKFDGGEETYGLLDADWVTPRQDGRLELLQSIQAAHRGPGINDEACPDPRYGALVFSDRDGWRSMDRSDWDVGAFKGTCNESEAVAGLSMTGGIGRKVHGALCTAAGASRSAVRFVEQNGRDAAGSKSHTGTDWAAGYTKVECASDEVVVGASQKNGWLGPSLHGVACASVGHPVRSCSTRVLDGGGDDRGSSLPNDWDPSYIKAQCAENEVVAGVSVRSGTPHSILCCRL
jgi:endoglucanase